MGHSTDPSVNLGIEGKVVRDGGFQVRELMHCDHGKLLDFLAHHVCLLQTDGQAEAFTGPGGRSGP